VLAPHLEQPVASAFEEVLVQVELGGEVVVEHGRGDARPATDLVEGGSVVAALREDFGRGPLDHLAAV